MAICKNIGFNTYSVTHNAFDGKSPAIDFGRYVLDCDTTPAFYLLVRWPIWHWLFRSRLEVIIDLAFPIFNINIPAGLLST